MLKLLYSLQLFVFIFKCTSVEDASKSSIDIANGTSYVNTTSSVLESIILTDRAEYPVGCSSNPGICGICEVCVDNNCLPHVMESIYNPNCSLIDHCKNNTCKVGNCVPTFGGYLCECPSNKEYGLYCNLTLKGKGKII